MKQEDTQFLNISSHLFFHKHIVSSRFKCNNLFSAENSSSIMLLTMFCVGLGHFREYKFRQNFLDILSPLCSFGGNVKSTSYTLSTFEFHSREKAPPLEDSKHLSFILEFVWITIVILLICVFLEFNFYHSVITQIYLMLR